MPAARVLFFRHGVPAWRTHGRVELALTDGTFWLRIEVNGNPPEDTTVDAFQVPGLMHNPHPVENAPLTIPKVGLGCDLKIPLRVTQPCPLGSDCPLEAT